MRRLPSFADERLTGFCVHCGGGANTRDHAPSKVFLDLPYPEYMPSVSCCERCNVSFSADEEYLAAFLDCVICGSTDPEVDRRLKVRKILSRNKKLRHDIESRKNEVRTSAGDTQLVWKPDQRRVRSVIVKLARCHAAYELSEPQLTEPLTVWAYPLCSMSTKELRSFEYGANGDGRQAQLVGWPEVGSRAMQRLIVGDMDESGGWITVQPHRYRFSASSDGEVIVRGVISEYLAYEVCWD